ncbi:MAG: hypothetical protein ACLUOI_14925 [Eisenbergiella sp.]
MNELYERIAGCNPNRRTLILTVLDGETAGEKACMPTAACSGLPEGRAVRKLRRRPSEISSPGIHTIEGDRYTVNFPAVNRSWSSAAADMFPFPHRIGRMIGCGHRTGNRRGSPTPPAGPERMIDLCAF